MCDLRESRRVSGYSWARTLSSAVDALSQPEPCPIPSTGAAREPWHINTVRELPGSYEGSTLSLSTPREIYHHKITMEQISRIAADEQLYVRHSYGPVELRRFASSTERPWVSFGTSLHELRSLPVAGASSRVHRAQRGIPLQDVPLAPPRDAPTVVENLRGPSRERDKQDGRNKAAPPESFPGTLPPCLGPDASITIPALPFPSPWRRTSRTRDRKSGGSELRPASPPSRKVPLLCMIVTTPYADNRVDCVRLPRSTLTSAEIPVNSRGTLA